MNGYLSVTLKEILHLRRDPTTVVIAMLIPILQMTIFGFAIDLDVRHISMVVADFDNSRESREFAQRLQNTQYVDITGWVRSPTEATQALRNGSARLALLIPPDFARKQAVGMNPAVQILLDGSDSIVAMRSQSAVMQAAMGKVRPEVEARLQVLYNPDMRSATYMIPGLIGVIMQIVTVALTSFSLVREKERGTMEQLMVSPVGRLALMLGKLTPYAGLALVEMTSVLLLGWIVFGVYVKGSVITLFFLSIPFILAALSLGLLISTAARDQAQALQYTLLTMLPSVLLSGFMFPRETMPGPIYLISFALPVTYFLQILRGVIVRGASFTELLPNGLALSLLAILLILISTARFRKAVP